MPTTLDSWLSQTVERALEPDIEICDPHHHLWEGRDGAEGDRYLVHEFLADAGTGHRIVSTVYAECIENYRADGPIAFRPVGETVFVETLTAKLQTTATAVAAGIVGYADLRLGQDVAPVLEAHIAAGKGRFRGVRNSALWDPDHWFLGVTPRHQKDVLQNAKFREGVQCLQNYGLSLDTAMFHTQLAELIPFAKDFPDLTIILDHTAMPVGVGPFAGRREEVFEAWREGMAAVSACSNVVVKVGALGQVFNGFEWHLRTAPPPGSLELADALAPYYLFCIDQFGPQRCMFESNFPVDRVSYSYTVLWNALKRMTTGYSKADRAALFHDTAARVYRL